MQKNRNSGATSPEVERVITEYYSRPDKDIPPQDGDETKTHIFRKISEQNISKIEEDPEEDK